MNQLLHFPEILEALPDSHPPATSSSLTSVVGGGGGPAALHLHDLDLLRLPTVAADGEYCRDVPASIAVIRGRPHRDEVPVREVIVLPLNHELVGTRGQVEAIQVQEFVRDPRVKEVSHPPWTDLPRGAGQPLLGIAP